MTPGERTRWAILQEASAIKAGNVHPRASFAEMGFREFQYAAEAIGEAIDRTRGASLGETIFAAAASMMERAGTNTSLGTILLIVPLAKLDVLPGEQRLGMNGEPWCRESLRRQLQATDPRDSERIYRAIRICNPGGMGRAEQMDLRESPPGSILDAMRIAAEWDDVALQYANGFEQVFQFANQLGIAWRALGELTDAIRKLQIEILASRPDSLIVRKHGIEIGREVQRRASCVQGADTYGSVPYESAWASFDAYLREPACRKNPGTTADLLAASLYVLSAGWT